MATSFLRNSRVSSVAGVAKKKLRHNWKKYMKASVKGGQVENSLDAQFKSVHFRPKFIVSNLKVA